MVVNVFKCACGHYNFDHAVTSAMERMKHRLLNDYPIGDGRCLKCDCEEMRINITKSSEPVGLPGRYNKDGTSNW